MAMTTNISNFEIKIDDIINSFNIINKIILCVCSCNKIYLYEFKKNSTILFQM